MAAKVGRYHTPLVLHWMNVLLSLDGQISSYIYGSDPLFLDCQRCAFQSYHVVQVMSVGYIGPPLVISASSVLPSLCVLAVDLRFYTRRKQHEDLRLDDWLTMPALVTMRYPQPVFRNTYRV